MVTGFAFGKEYSPLATYTTAYYSFNGLGSDLHYNPQKHEIH